jgi:acetamidase/formamidase
MRADLDERGAEPEMKRIGRPDAHAYEMVLGEPKLVVEPGERFVVETDDALNGVIRREDQLPVPDVLGARLERGEFNPLAGPIVVSGAKAGDTLVVNVEEIVVADQGVSCIFEGMGPLGDSATYPECRGPYTTVIRHLPGESGTTSDGKAVFEGRIEWPLVPHIGTIGTTPLRPIAAGADSVFGQGPHGGNMDVRDVRKGHRIMLPVFHDGAYLYVGDVHASEADSELYGEADESQAEVTLSCEIVPGKSIPWARIETPESLIQLHSFRPVEDALQQAFRWMLDWVVEDYGMRPIDAYRLMSIAPGVRIHVYQMVKLGRIAYTVGVEFPKAYLVP